MHRSGVQRRDRLDLNGSGAARGGLLAFVYCLGLGLPFVLVALGFAVVLRGLSAHRVPWGNMYEFPVAGALS